MVFFQTFQLELDTFVDLWNDHRIQPKHNETISYGPPSFMYECPQAFDTTNYCHPVGANYIDACKDPSICKQLEELPCDEDVYEMCITIMAECGQDEPPASAEDALVLYLMIRPILRALL